MAETAGQDKAWLLLVGCGVKDDMAYSVSTGAWDFIRRTVTLRTVRDGRWKHYLFGLFLGQAIAENCTRKSRPTRPLVVPTVGSEMTIRRSLSIFLYRDALVSGMRRRARPCSVALMSQFCVTCRLATQMS